MKIALDKHAIAPTRAHETDAGLDLYSPHDEILRARGAVNIRTGVRVQLPAGFAGLLVSKSGLNTRYGITSTGLIDEGYTGEIVVRLQNNSDKPYLIARGDKISQLVLIPVLYEPVEVVDEIEGGERGEDGFGSTGR